MRPVLFLYSVLLTFLAPAAFAVGYPIAIKKKAARHFAERFGLIKLNSFSRSKSVWFHCASVGEVKSIKKLADSFRKRYPGTAVIVSTMTEAGRRHAIEFVKADETFLLPIENSAAISHIIKLLGVKVFFIVDTEIWPALINTAAAHCRLILINAKMSDKTFVTYYRLRCFFKPLFGKFSAILAKSREDMEKFKKISGSSSNIAAIGNIKFQERKKIESVSPIPELKETRYIVAASTHRGEEEIILEAFGKGGDGYDALIIAPRHVERAPRILETARKAGFEASLYSEKNFLNRVIIVDSFGILERLYIKADKIFVGGSLTNIGGHNIFEAVQFCKKVAVGPYMQNFEEIFVPASSAGLATVVKSPEDVARWMEAPETGGNFETFFAEIEKNNEKLIENIQDLADDLLASETDNNSSE